MDGVTVTRIGTQVVVRLSGKIGDAKRDRLEAALGEVRSLALSRVVVDLDDVTSIEGAGIEFIVELHRLWRVRLLNTPVDLREHLPRKPAVAAASP